MITRLDDFPIHQIAQPIAQTASSDRCHYDRFWYNGHDAEGEFYLGLACAAIPTWAFWIAASVWSLMATNTRFTARAEHRMNPLNSQLGHSTCRFSNPWDATG